MAVLFNQEGGNNRSEALEVVGFKGFLSAKKRPLIRIACLMKSVDDLANLVLFIHIGRIIPTFKSEVLEIVGFENSDRSIVKTSCFTKKTRFKTKEGTDRSC